MSEEDPDVSAPAGLRYLEGSRNLMGAGCFHVRERIEHRGLFVEVRCDPPAGVVIAEWIQTDVRLAPQVGVNDYWGRGEVGCVGSIHSLAPMAFDRRHPT